MATIKAVLNKDRKKKNGEYRKQVSNREIVTLA